MGFYMLQQPIRWAEWSFACCNNPFGGQNGILHGCNTISYACKPLLHRWDDPSAVAERLFSQHSNHVL